MNARMQKALAILNAIAPRQYLYLGQGATSVVYHDHSRVYRVFFTEDLSLQTPKSHLLQYIKDHGLFADSQFLYPLEAIEAVGGNKVQIYQYEPSEP